MNEEFTKSDAFTDAEGLRSDLEPFRVNLALLIKGHAVLATFRCVLSTKDN